MFVICLNNDKYCHVYGVRVTKVTGSSSDDWMYSLPNNSLILGLICAIITAEKHTHIYKVLYMHVCVCVCVLWFILGLCTYIR
jgi:hypothetical protein